IMVSTEKVRQVAKNARINLDDEEVEQFASEFDKILDMFQALEEVDTEDVEPAFHPIDVEPETREDEKEETLDHEEVFQNTDNEEDGFFKGPSA
ncbi:MAG: Asp-tRNA(Asn)/Glu-tRNA(Gln) amidotransferase subunit GatC, partial [Candidatus Aenigmatarchaeota archaeon]